MKEIRRVVVFIAFDDDSVTEFDTNAVFPNGMSMCSAVWDRKTVEAGVDSRGHQYYVAGPEVSLIISMADDARSWQARLLEAVKNLP